MLMWKVAALPLALFALASNAPAGDQCSAPVPVPATVTTPNSTYYSDSMPPVRFRKNNRIMVRFSSQAEIDTICGKAPCDMITLGCQSNAPRLMILPNPCSYGADDPYAQLACHELGHLNGWPATHGD